MASVRASTPESESATMSPTQLSPNSKVKALMAGFDDDSDGESYSGNARDRLMATLTKQTTTKNDHSTDKNKSGEARGALLPKELESDSEEDIVQPKGRLAARMQADEQISKDASATDDMRESSKKMLTARRKSPLPTSNAETKEGSEDSEAPVASRKRKVRVPRQDTPMSSPARSAASPALFVSPSKNASASPNASGSDSDIPEVSTSNARFMALVEKKKQERLARDAEKQKEKDAKAADRRRLAEVLEQDREDSDDTDGRRLTQQMRGTRKASKKALEDMHRETQRLSRNQQLAHNATTKKKITKASLFAKFNYKPAGHIEDHLEVVRPTSSSSAAALHSDLDTKSTPPSSPPSQQGEADKESNLAPAINITGVDNEDLPDLQDVLSRLPSSPSTCFDKGKGKAVEEPQELVVLEKQISTKKPIRVRPPKAHARETSVMDVSDSDLEIVPAKKMPIQKRIDAVFDNFPAKQSRESHGLHTLRMLAHLGSPGKQNIGRSVKPSITTSELQMSLQQRARQQAAREREERLQYLRDKGIIVQTAEEREKEMAEVDDMLALARREGEEISKREKAAAKKERMEKGKADPLGDNSSDDDDYQEDNGNNEIPEEDVSVSGSEDDGGDEASGSEDEEDPMDVDEEEAESALSGIFDNEASEADEDEVEAEAQIASGMMAAPGEDDEDEEIPTFQASRRNRKANVISDDEDDDAESLKQAQTPSVRQFKSPLVAAESPIAPNSVLRSATKTFIPGVTVAGVAGLGLTQIFAGTMDESQMEPFDCSQTVPESPQMLGKQDSMAFLKRISAPELPPFAPTMSTDTQEVETTTQSQSQVPESQLLDSATQGIQLDFSQSQVHGFDSLVDDASPSQALYATQDGGFQDMTPIRGRFTEPPHSTVDTLILEPAAVPEITDETPVIKKKGKLRRRAPVLNFSDEEDAAEPAEAEKDLDITANAFDVMRKSIKKKAAVDEFNKKRSEAKNMVNEQAEESEDEYAGLGGASDDESGGEEDEYVKAIIDDEGGKDADERQLAALYADRERANDAKQVEKLFNDITNGNLRRKRGADYDLSDSDDGGEAKKRRKRREFAKMRKALLSDERMAKIAENPKRQAFLRAIEDRGSADEMDFLDEFPEAGETDSQSQSQAEGSESIVPDSQPVSMGPPKQSRSCNTVDVVSRPLSCLRRTKQGKKPSNLSEIRESLSSLIEEPNAVIAPEDSDSEDDLEIEDDYDLGSGAAQSRENRDPFAVRRTAPGSEVIDRISLKRESSNSSVSKDTRLAFAASSAAPGFKVPALLKRATTNSSIISSASSSSVSGTGMSATERMAGGGEGGDGVKRGGGKNSGVNYFARESERRAGVVKTERRREAKLVKGAKARSKVVGGLFGGGKFE